MAVTVQQRVNLAPLNTLAVPAIASYFVAATDLTELREALAFAAAESLPVVVFGGGSNMVLGPTVSGLVLHVNLQGVELLQDECDQVTVRVAAGENWHQFVERCIEQDWYGLENLALIPGTVGAAPVQNIGAYGVELASVVASVDAVHIASGESRQFSPAECEFGYRDSVFKGAVAGDYVITAVTFRLRKTPSLAVSYPGLQSMLQEQLSMSENAFSRALLAGQISPRDVFESVCELRRRKLPDPAVIPNCGSFFKNPVVTTEVASRLLAEFPSMVTYPASGGVKLAAGWLIDQCGWKGYNYDGQIVTEAGVHQHQALVLINPNHLSGAAVLSLAERICASVKEKFGVVLHIEPHLPAG